jgi:hypothetical protein
MAVQDRWSMASEGDGQQFVAKPAEVVKNNGAHVKR